MLDSRTDTELSSPIATVTNAGAAECDSIPAWFSNFLDDRQTRKPSAHTMKAYRQDFIAVATLITGGNPVDLAITDITKDSGISSLCRGWLRRASERRTLALM
jgi:hypothetical protein